MWWAAEVVRDDASDHARREQCLDAGTQAPCRRVMAYGVADQAQALAGDVRARTRPSAQRTGGGRRSLPRWRAPRRQTRVPLAEQVFVRGSRANERVRSAGADVPCAVPIHQACHRCARSPAVRRAGQPGHRFTGMLPCLAARRHPSRAARRRRRPGRRCALQVREVRASLPRSTIGLPVPHHGARTERQHRIRHVRH